ncbi:ATP phosphoribosyltransferase [Adlercreutzia sp. ZJ138]|uniref:ATP phosphoribosyltransferase n=1 Tax=Adlercreutzia sp. ZJ138 TaxID=2709405 RepID=UPI001F14ABBB|nr:ATP phosphoribosyltransferase [Adlercreutzia sp. ZJ138]
METMQSKETRDMNYVTPSGFRDVLVDEALLRERATRDVQQLLASRGYAPIETPTLEIMDVMRSGGRLPGTPFKFFDSRGDLLAMRPDVTLQVARMCATRLAGQPGPFRFRYTQRVFREAEGQMQAEARETTQLGVELIGEAGVAADAEAVELLAESLEAVGVGDYRIAIATVGVLQALLAATSATAQWKDDVLAAYHASNFVDLDALTVESVASASGASPVFANAIRELPRIRGGREAISRVRDLVRPLGCEGGLVSLEGVLDALDAAGLADRVLVDFSVMSSFDYYTGIIFKAYAPVLGTPLGGGGRYDSTLGAYGESRPAAGFAFYLENALASCCERNDVVREERPLRIAVPKGSLHADAVACLEACGLDVTGLDNPGRQLIIRNPGVEYVIVRPSDAPAFVESGAADCGICGEDSLLETDPDIVELVDLKFGACRFIVAEPAGAAEANAEHYRRLGSLRVATKYPRITAAHFARRGTQVEIVKLHGNIELAPLTGMAECIVDITATGTTLRENNLVITDEVLSSTARFFANVSAFRTDARVAQLASKLQAGVDAGKWNTTVIAGGEGK